MKPSECSFCMRQEKQYRARIFGPCSVAICEDCVRTLEPHALEGTATFPSRTFEVTAEWLAHYGGGATPDDVAHLFGSRHGPSRICDACVRLALDLVTEEGA